MPRTHRTGRRPDPTVLSLQTEVSSSESPTPSPRSQGPVDSPPCCCPSSPSTQPRRRDETAEHQPGKGPVGIAHRGSTSTSTPALPREKVGPTTQHVLTSMNRTSTPSGSRRSSCSARRRSHTCSNRARSSGPQRSRWANAPRTPLQPRSVADPNSIAGRSTHDRLAARRSCCGARDRPGVNTPTSCVRGVSPISSSHPGRSADASPGSSPAYDRRLGPSDRTQNRWWARSGFRRLGRSGPTPADARSPGAYRASTTTPRRPPHPRSTAWPRPSTSGGQPSWRACRPGTRTRGRKATTGSPNTRAGTLSGSETRSTSDDAYAGPAPANTDGKQPGKPLCPVNFEEP